MLSGGGARGAAHIGVLKVLEEFRNDAMRRYTALVDSLEKADARA